MSAIEPGHKQTLLKLVPFSQCIQVHEAPCMRNVNKMCRHTVV